MPHKITLTGKSQSTLREYQEGVYSFDMTESGSPAAPKGLPKSNEIQYTVFVSEKQLRKAKIDKEVLSQKKVLIQGEPTLDIPVDQCPGEIAVICFQIQTIEPKSKEEKKEEKFTLESPPKGTSEFLPIDTIVIPEDFKHRPPHPDKLKDRKQYLIAKKLFKKPILVNPTTKEIVDGYTWYVAAKELNADKVPVTYI
jgi:hypothetical protein